MKISRKNKIRGAIFIFLLAIIIPFACYDIFFVTQLWRDNNPLYITKEEFQTIMTEQGYDDAYIINEYPGKKVCEEVLYSDPDNAVSLSYFRMQSPEIANEYFEKIQIQQNQSVTDSNIVNFSYAKYYECINELQYMIFLKYEDVIMQGVGRIEDKDIIKKNLIMILTTAVTKN